MLSNRIALSYWIAWGHMIESMIMNNKPVKTLSGRSAEEWQELLWDKLIEGLFKIKSKQDFKSAIESLFSSREKRFMLRRLATNTLIKQGRSYRAIGETLWISPSTISVIKKNILNRYASYKSRDAFSQEKKKLINAMDKSRQSSVEVESPIEKIVEGVLGVFFGSPDAQRGRGDYFARRVMKGK